uniref:Uncharacterized protein n=1 Tax=Panagrolaimus sp. PS1159 TaxID=55785 RepID=A0AC35FLF8_9BILA
MWLSSLLFLLIIQATCSFMLPRMFSGRPLTGFDQRFHKFDEFNKNDTIDDQYFEQILDHFDSTNNSVTFKQRFWNYMELSKPNSPQFLMMGQEMPGSVFSLTTPSMWAQKFNAGIWALEHRFYGKSQPFKEQTVESLKYLSSRQYLADVANFIRTQNQNLTNPKWVVFGGSYSGSLALWFRQLYPELAVGAVGSSGPIQPLLDFYEFNQVVENSIRHRDPKCAKNTKKAFKLLEKYMEYEEGRDELNAVFA